MLGQNSMKYAIPENYSTSKSLKLKILHTSCDFSYSFFHTEPALSFWRLLLLPHLILMVLHTHPGGIPQSEFSNTFCQHCLVLRLLYFCLDHLDLALLKSRSFSMRSLNNLPLQLNTSWSSSHSPHE